jgi:hypothetical protein
LLERKQDVDARHKAGYDEQKRATEAVSAPGIAPKVGWRRRSALLRRCRLGSFTFDRKGAKFCVLFTDFLGF